MSVGRDLEVAFCCIAAVSVHGKDLDFTITPCVASIYFTFPFCVDLLFI